ncbi:hypothetical protein DL546_008608 [Coniochaeta pulveracea]|uniref:Extracellular membrane protein CFEM domain-containing protein n=2 Tax=Coniochaeta pulveracea TaxID=177199 RepID=A0A420YFX1_9PEZI|nr:hypothetical protein DL546_008608 [Coniochaeta pulveracea]
MLHHFERNTWTNLTTPQTFNHRMASRSLRSLAVWTSAVTALSTEITKFLPTCAVDCVQSFVSENYESSNCGSSPSLECLCQHTGKSGFTIGEGGVQCLIAEINRNACQGDDASPNAIAKAYRMCSGVASAAPETHSTIVATLVVPSGTGPVQVPGGSTSTRSSMTQTSSTLVTASPASSTSESLGITPVPMASTTTAPTAATSSQPTSTTISAAPSNRPVLNTTQIVGISVGIAVTLLVAAGLIFLARWVRRRNFGDQESGFYKPKRQSKGFGLLKSNQSSPQVLQISAPIHKTPVEMEFRRPGDFQTPPPRVGQGAIGLAISPPMMSSSSVDATPRMGPRVAVAQPAKTYQPYRPGGVPGASSPPKLTLNIPRQPPQPVKQPRTGLSARTRDSVMTEFQEDGEGESMRRSSVWRPPSTDPKSATTYYVPDKFGNWMLRNKNSQDMVEEQPPVELPSPANRTKMERATDVSPDSPTEKTIAGWVPQVPTYARPRQSPSSAEGAPILGSPFRFNTRTQPQPGSTSSIYSNFSFPHPAAPGPTEPLPPLPQIHPALRPQTKPPGPNFSKRYSQPARQGSQDSATTIESSGAEPFTEEGRMIEALQDSLSPVQESPRTPKSAGRSPVSKTAGKSPISYQRSQNQGTPERKRDRRSTPPRSVHPHQQPAYSLFPHDNLPPPPAPSQLGITNPAAEQPSPIPGPPSAKVSPLRPQRPIGLPSNPAASRGQYSRPVGLAPAPPANPAAVMTGSPELRTGSAPPEGSKQRLQPHHHHRRQSSLQLRQQKQSLHSHIQNLQVQAAVSRSPESQPPPSSQPRGPLMHPLQTQFPNLRVTDATPISATTTSSGNSSWLATKRLGVERAAALALREDGGGGGQRDKWKRDGGEEGNKELPATPGWKPKLTPTRRGDDLFLNVG